MQPKAFTCFYVADLFRKHCTTCTAMREAVVKLENDRNLRLADKAAGAQGHVEGCKESAVNCEGHRGRPEPEPSS